jgi:two-component system OmpR family response regulator
MTWCFGLLLCSSGTVLETLCTFKDPDLMPRKILIVEDEPDLARLVQVNLKDIGCAGAIAFNCAQAKALFSQSEYQLVVLDRMLPDGDGLTLCRQFRQNNATLPILMLTARSTELDRVVGLEIGADDYLTKPFSIAELLARVKALFRRVDAYKANQANPDQEPVIQHGGLSIDVARRQVMLEEKPLELTAREFDLLLFFARHPGRVFTRLQLLNQVWGYNHDGYEHTVNSHINRLRSKLEADPAHPHYVITVWGVGYKLADAAS